MSLINPIWSVIPAVALPFYEKGIEHKSGSTLVGVKSVSMFKDFFQHLVLNHPHLAMEELYHRQHNDLPSTIEFFAAAYTFMNDFWSNEQNINLYLKQHGHKS